ncbi:MAG: cytochrome c1 [Rubrivivax sp.]|jgi:ubiquinol-cytochrome c reductase cytochrome c1 subunit|nr:cytochrome c1 [Rubrivivax sp.]
MKKILLAWLASLFLVSTAHAAGGSLVPWETFPREKLTDKAALQNGARLFANYCLSCHSASFMRWNRLQDIGLTEAQIKDNLIFTGAKVGETMKIAMDPKSAKDWFGGVPPDLTLIARSRAGFGMGANSGADYLYTFLRGYYRDETKATGWNNVAFPGVGMPHVLWELQGPQQAVFVEQKDPHNPAHTVQAFKGFEPIAAGTRTQAQYNSDIADLVAFLVWMGEPNAAARFQLGVWVVLFLGVFTVIAWRLNAAFWKDVK